MKVTPSLDSFLSYYKFVSFGKVRWSCAYKLVWTRTMCCNIIESFIRHFYFGKHFLLQPCVLNHNKKQISFAPPPIKETHEKEIGVEIWWPKCIGKSTESDEQLLKSLMTCSMLWLLAKACTTKYFIKFRIVYILFRLAHCSICNQPITTQKSVLGFSSMLGFQECTNGKSGIWFTILISAYIFHLIHFNRFRFLHVPVRMWIVLITFESFVFQAPGLCLFTWFITHYQNPNRFDNGNAWWLSCMWFVFYKPPETTNLKAKIHFWVMFSFVLTTFSTLSILARAMAAVNMAQLRYFPADILLFRKLPQIEAN